MKGVCDWRVKCESPGVSNTSEDLRKYPYHRDPNVFQTLWGKHENLTAKDISDS